MQYGIVAWTLRLTRGEAYAIWNSSEDATTNGFVYELRLEAYAIWNRSEDATTNKIMES